MRPYTIPSGPVASMLHIIQRSEAFLLRRRYAVMKDAGRTGAHEYDERSEQNPAFRGKDLAREGR